MSNLLLFLIASLAGWRSYQKAEQKKKEEAIVRNANQDPLPLDGEEGLAVGYFLNDGMDIDFH